MREKMKEEAKVIENCLRTNSMSKKESSLYNPSSKDKYLHMRGRSQHKVEKEIPVFNPSNYVYQSYPHIPRGRGHHVYKNSSETCSWYLQTENIVHNDMGGAKYAASPVFEVKSRSSMHTSKFACVPSQC